MKPTENVFQNNDKSNELSDKDLELVVGGIMSEIVIRETMENVTKLSDKIDRINNEVKK